MLKQIVPQGTRSSKWAPAIQAQAGVNVTEVVSSFKRGGNRYLNGDAPQACRNEQERAGYMAMLNCIADAETEAYLATVPQWQLEPDADAEWIRRGM